MTGDRVTIELLGKQFEVADRVGLMPLLRFAHLAKRGATTEDVDALVTMYEILQSVIADADWDAFSEHATLQRATNEDILGCIKTAIETISSRPTPSPSGVPDGRRIIETSSSDVLFSTESSTPDYPIESRAPLLRDERVLQLVPLADAAKARRTG